MPFTEKQIVDVLTRGGISLERYFVLEGDLIAYDDDSGQLMARIIEDDALALSTVKLLKSKGQVRSLPTKR